MDSASFARDVTLRATPTCLVPRKPQHNPSSWLPAFRRRRRMLRWLLTLQPWICKGNSSSACLAYGLSDEMVRPEFDLRSHLHLTVSPLQKMTFCGRTIINKERVANPSLTGKGYPSPPGVRSPFVRLDRRLKLSRGLEAAHCQKQAQLRRC